MDVKKACRFNEVYHSRLPRIHWSNVVRNKKSVCYKAIHGSEIYAVGIWSSPISSNLDGEKILELRRYAIREESPKNTGSRVLSIMEKLIKDKWQDIERLISYQDTEVHDGTIYKASNWEKGRHTEYQSWDHGSRDRKESQSKADKIRWEKIVR